MTQSVLERTGEQVAAVARKASRTTSGLVEALQDGVEAARRVAKQGGDVAEEFVDHANNRLKRHPAETVVATFAIGVTLGIFIGWMMKRR